MVCLKHTARSQYGLKDEKEVATSIVMRRRSASDVDHHGIGSREVGWLVQAFSTFSHKKSKANPRCKMKLLPADHIFSTPFCLTVISGWLKPAAVCSPPGVPRRKVDACRSTWDLAIFQISPSTFYKLELSPTHQEWIVSTFLYFPRRP